MRTPGLVISDVSNFNFTSRIACRGERRAHHFLFLNFLFALLALRARGILVHLSSRKISRWPRKLTVSSV